MQTFSKRFGRKSKFADFSKDYVLPNMAYCCFGAFTVMVSVDYGI